MLRLPAVGPMLMWPKVLVLFVLVLTGGNAQERPAYYVPNWTTNVTYRQDFCEQNAAVEQGKLELREALRGLHLTIGFLNYQLNQETGAIDPENPDLGIEFMDELARRAGFTYRHSYGVVDPPGQNKTWTELLEFMTDVYDVTGEWFVQTTERLERNIIYPEPWQDANYIMVMKADEKTEFNLFAFTKPFTPAVWGLIAITIIVSGLLYYLLDYFDSRIKRRPMDVGLESSLFLSAFTFNGHYAHEPKSRSTRILVFSMAFFFLLIVACYTANLASFLVLRNQRLVVADVQDAIKRDLTFCVADGSPYFDYLNTFRIQPKHLVATKALDGDEADGVAFLSLLEGKCDLVFTNKGAFEKYTRSKRHNPDCNLQFVGRIQKFVSGGFALKGSEQYCSSLVRDALHLHMYEMKGTTTFSTIWDNFHNKAATNTCNTNAVANAEDENYVSMGWENLSGMFFLHAVALLVALAGTLFQFRQQPLSRRKGMINELKNCLFGNTTLSRAVEVVCKQEQIESDDLGKNNLTSNNGEVEIASPADLPMIGKQISPADRNQSGFASDRKRTIDVEDKLEEMMAAMEKLFRSNEKLFHKVEQVEKKVELIQQRANQ